MNTQMQQKIDQYHLANEILEEVGITTTLDELIQESGAPVNDITPIWGGQALGKDNDESVWNNLNDSKITISVISVDNKERTDKPIKYTKERAIRITRKLIKDGYLRKEPCRHCGSSVNVIAEIKDNTKPFDVEWACSEYLN